MPYSYTIVSDSNSDMPYSLVDEHQIHMVYMPYTIFGEEHFPDLGRGHGQKEFYAAVRGGAMSTTSLITEPHYIELLEPLVAAGQDILFIAFSSAMSNTMVNARRALATLSAKYPERKLVLFDTLTIAMAEGLLVLHCARMREAGAGMDEVVEWLQENHLRAHAWVAVDDLKYLRRGGRISGASAVIGSILDVKPILTIDNTGIVVPHEKVQGKKRAMRTLVSRLEEFGDEHTKGQIFLMHADNEPDARRVAELIAAHTPYGEVPVCEIGPVVGTHCGPGTLALVFLGQKRNIQHVSD